MATADHNQRYFKDTEDLPAKKAKARLTKANTLAVIGMATSHLVGATQVGPT